MHRAPLTLAGNSHLVHFQRAIDMGATPAPRRPLQFHARLALSLLHPFFEDDAVTRPGQECLLMVPGFRIGNRVLTDPAHPEAHASVDAALITPEHDAQMLERYLNRLDDLRRRNPAIRFLFWSLVAGEYRARSEGRYLQPDGTYRHPTWNLAEIEREFPEHTISLAPLLDSDVLPALLKDSGGHPTELAAALFHRFIEDPERPTDQALAEVRRTATVPCLSFWEPTVLTGDSAWLATLADYAERGIIRLNQHVRIIADSARITARDGVVLYITDLDGTALRAGQGDHGSDAARLPEEALAPIRRLAALGLRPRVFTWANKANEFTNPPVTWAPDHPGSPMALDEQLAARLPEADVLRDAHWAPHSVSLRDVDIEQLSGRPKPTVDGLSQVVRLLGGGRTLQWLDE
ncbi:hypothetical protein [Zhihengliuella flava]|uniref:Uncharacterized protein n=1 Tax=Zhihengliuella flava TaxID=1285193 RepID=A0A931GL31_9MICC|nr:hypothetical protein [Zhihengliuella flava]MBG6084079.1 hypothetical protein [Zhihengliuella flava]